VLLWKCGFRANGTRRIYKTIDQGSEEPNGRAFRDREFFTRIIQLRQDPPIRYREGRILFPSPGKTLRISVTAANSRHTGFSGSPYEIIKYVFHHAFLRKRLDDEELSGKYPK